MNGFEEFALNAGQWLDAAGVVIILVGVLFSTIVVLIRAVRARSIHHLYRLYRQNLARSILIGLEFLVAGDIIRTVAGQMNFDSVIILAIIVIVRSFLGVEFEMEVEGYWPWQRAKLNKKQQV